MIPILTYPDRIIIITYFVVMLLAGIYYIKSNQNSEDYFLGGRGLNWMAIGISLFAINLSGEQLVGLVGVGAQNGYSGAGLEWLPAMMPLLLAWLFVPLYLNSGIMTLPQFLEKRYNRFSRIFFSSLSLLFYLFIRLTVILFVAGFLLYRILGWDVVTTAVVLVMVTGIYTIFGGFRAVIFTEVIQGLILISAIIAIIFFGLSEIGSVSNLKAQMPERFFQMYKAGGNLQFSWIGIILGTPIIGIWYWCTDQYVVQRVLAARNVAQARGGAIFASYLKVILLFVLIFLGIIAISLFPEIYADEAFPALINSHVLPNGIKGLVIVAILSAIMSSLSALFSSSSALFTLDFYKLIRPQSNERELVLIGRLTTALFVVAAILSIPLLKNLSTEIFIYFQKIPAYIAPPVAAVFLFGIIFKKINGRGAVYALSFGTFLGVLRLLIDIFAYDRALHVPVLRWFAQIHFLHFAIGLFVLSGVVLYFGSLIPGRSTGAKRTPVSLVRKFHPKSAVSLVRYRYRQIGQIGASFLLVVIVFGIWFTFL
ncbi:MAG: sodium/solute symporter [Calditrichaeota bacterium]|nr:sodium/solute symporter [Calditrichota bacterium]